MIGSDDELAYRWYMFINKMVVEGSQVAENGQLLWHLVREFMIHEMEHMYEEQGEWDAVNKAWCNLAREMNVDKFMYAYNQCVAEYTRYKDAVLWFETCLDTDSEVEYENYQLMQRENLLFEDDINFL